MFQLYTLNQNKKKEEILNSLGLNCMDSLIYGFFFPLNMNWTTVLQDPQLTQSVDA